MNDNVNQQPSQEQLAAGIAARGEEAGLYETELFGHICDYDYQMRELATKREEGPGPLPLALVVPSTLAAAFTACAYNFHNHGVSEAETRVYMQHYADVLARNVGPLTAVAKQRFDIALQAQKEAAADRGEVQ